ncbi:MAG: TetR/AcrR family transcriptional regulator [Deltaproteobacteria bacterium]|nr:TetR/AcrR family transcriptional regulator [Deltaproteobacteria bacterium]
MLTRSTGCFILRGTMKKKKNAYHHGDLRAALLETTAKIIMEEGIHKVSMRALSNSIGVSRTAPYRHFTDKKSLLCAVAEHGFKLLSAEIKRATNTRGSGVKRFEKMALAYINFALNNPAYYNLMFGKEMASDSPPEVLLVAAMAVLEEAVIVIESCQREGYFRKQDPNMLANVSWSTVHGLASLLIDGQIRSEDKPSGEYNLVSDDSVNTGVKRLAKSTIKILIKGMK